MDDYQLKTERLKKGFLVYLDQLSSKPYARNALYVIAILFFVLIILIPPLMGVFTNWSLIGETFRDLALLSRASSAIAASFFIAFIVSTLDVLTGLPLAWLIANRRSRWINIIDTIADIPFILPTVALGFSTLTYWSSPQGLSGWLGVESILSPGMILIMLLHFTFSYPIIVRILVGAFQEYEKVYEIVARTLGASPLTAARTVTLPILKPSLISAFLLAFSRSLSETGATMIVAGAFENGPVFIVNARSEGLQGPMVFVSLFLIVASCIIFAIISTFGPRLRFTPKRVWPDFEKRMSAPNLIRFRDASTLLIFFFFVAAPSLFVALPGLWALFGDTAWKAIQGVGVWSDFWRSLLNSYIIGITATLVNVALGLPMALIIARRRFGPRMSAMLRVLISIPIVIPSVALGISISLFWSSLGGFPEFLVLILVHTTITYTYFVQTMSAAIEGVPENLEEVAQTLGGRPFEIFRRISLPLTKYSIFSGGVIMLTRSIDETGATLAVSKEIKTAPVLVVDWIRHPEIYEASTVGFGILILVLTAFISLLIIRLVLKRR